MSFTTGFEDFITTYHCGDLSVYSIRSVEYDDLYRSPWAKTRDMEILHEKLMTSIGLSLKGDMFASYDLNQ